MCKLIILFLAIFSSIYLIFDIIVIMLNMYSAIKMRRSYNKTLWNEILVIAICSMLWTLFILL